MKTKMFLSLITISILTLNPVIIADKIVKPFRAKSIPVIDGKLDDPIWKEAVPLKGFVTYFPDQGKKASEETEVLIAYDKQNLFFAFICYDSQPDKIKSSITNRDNISADDWVCVNLDSQGDQQSSINFLVNPHGIQADSKISGGQESYAFDAVWYSGSKINENGYTVEVMIPLKSIRYSGDDVVTMRMLLERKISRITEHSSFPQFKPESSAFNQMLPLEFLNLEKQTLFEILPALTYSKKLNNISGSLIPTEDKRDFSLTAKYGLTSSLILDATYNPDFSQVEADAGQVDINLRYSLYYPEKRPFFQEGSENFRLGGIRPIAGDPLQYIVHTRNIINPIAGIKLSGKMGEKNTLAVLFAADEPIDNNNSSSDKYIQNYVLRYKRNFNDDSFTGIIYADKEFNHEFNRIIGLDGFQRLSDNSTLGYYFLLSNTKRNGSDKGSFGNNFNLRYTNLSREFDWRVMLRSSSQNFKADMGYLTRNGVFSFGGMIIPKFYPDWSFIRQIRVALNSENKIDYESKLWETFDEITFLAEVDGATSLILSYVYATEIFNKKKFDISMFWLSASSQITKELYFDLTYVPANAIYYSDNPFQGYKNQVTSNLIYQPAEKINAELNYIYSDFYRESDSKKIYSYQIYRGKLTYQINQYLFIRGILEYNDYRKEIATDFLASFTYIPGTVLHVGYGSQYKKTEWESERFVESNRFTEMKRGFFFKMSYLWRV
jgi:hypothetical protein